MAFQIVDDVLDLTASENVLGKPVASDLREGKVTMAVIHALERCTPGEREAIETVLQERAFDGVTHQEIIAILERYGSLDAANATGHAVCRPRPQCNLQFSRQRNQARAAVGAGVRSRPGEIDRGQSPQGVSGHILISPSANNLSVP